MDYEVNIVKRNDKEIITRILEIEKEVFGDAGLCSWSLIPLIRHGRLMTLVYFDQIVGSAQFFRDWEEPGRVYLVGIAIDKNHQGKGLGTLFLKECLDKLRKEGINKVELTVHPKNYIAKKIYMDKLGFRIFEEREDEYGPGEDRLAMVLTL